LYQGKKKAIMVDKTKINIPKNNLKVITFQTILLELALSLAISLIEIAYKPKSAKNTKIQV
jgi:hypothetical protein